MKPSDIEDKLRNKFKFQSKDSHKKHRWWELKLPGIAPVATFFSHSKAELGPVIEGKIAKQLKVNGSYLRAMVSCSKDCEEYYTHLRNN